MAKLKLTKRAIERLPAPDPSGRQRLVWDSELTGFGLLISGATPTKSLVVQREIHGRTRRVTLGTVAELEASGKSLDDVRAQAAEMLVAMRRGKDPRAKADGNVTLRKALDLYFAARPNLSAASTRQYRGAIEHHFVRWLDKPLGDISAGMIEARYREIKSEVAEARKKDLDARIRTAEKRGETPPTEPALFVSEPGAATANAAMRALRAVWGFCRARSQEIPPWPTERLRGQWYRVPRRERHVAADDLAKFYAAVNEKEEGGEFVIGRAARDFILLLLYTGMRHGEAASLRWSDVDLAGRVLRIPAARTKARRLLNLPLTDLTCELLFARRALGVDGEFIFPGPGKRGHIEEPRRPLAKVAEKCGVVANPHCLRATYATVAADVAMSAYALKALLNHALGDDVTAGYIKPSVDQLRGPAQAVADRLKQFCQIETPEGVERIRR